MILTRIELTNYKQYGGHHVVEIPQSGAIGVIGANGVGKTTLFEAIEWALYSPSTIKAADVRPRVWRGKTEVKVTLDDPTTGGRFLIERELGKGSAKARIYRVDQFGFEEKIVDGAAQVTAYVTDNLIGLEHVAFVATFFTRQKELGFFNGSPTARRREVGKLLGLETIRQAQQLIAEDRKRAQADARSYQAQSDAQMKDRDFPAEIVAAEVSISDAKGAFDVAVSAVESVKATTAQAEKAMAEIERVRDQDSVIHQNISHRQREHDVAKEQVIGSTRELTRLDSLAVEREKNVPVAARAEALQTEATSHDGVRQKSLRKKELEQQIAALQRRDDEATVTIRQAIHEAPAPDKHPAWNAENARAAADWAAGINLAALEERTAAISRAIEANDQFNKESQILATYRKRVEQLLSEQKALLEAGDPGQRIPEVQQALQELNGSNSAASSAATRARNDLQKTERILANLRTQHEGETCPTCQRPFTSDETAHAITIFEREIHSHKQHLLEIDALISANNVKIAAAEADRKDLDAASKQLIEIRSRIETGNNYVQDQQIKVDDLSARLHQVLESLGRTSAPTVQERDESHQELGAWRQVVNAAANVARALQSRAQIADERVPVERDLQSLADVAYDEARHREVTEHLQIAKQAQRTIERIDADLANRQHLVGERDAAVKIVDEAQRDLAILHRERTALGFDINAYQQSQIVMRSAQEQERIATENKHRADVAVNNAEHGLKSIASEQERIGKLAIAAEAKQREADDLDLMYREFTEFERYAAAWYAPRLSEIASDLVAQVTDGKYDRVEFDNNFSIQVYDGDDEKFPYETFSGGERDAIALCARIALSRVIGGASANPPGFLVLDEVFGSLDLERRQRLLEMLAAITGADDHFRQVFIISHVDDVRTSPILDDIWRVSETESGTSELQTLGVGVDIGEL